MKLTIPAISYLQPEDLKRSRIPDKYVSSITTLIIPDALLKGEYYVVSHVLRGKKSLVNVDLLEGPYDEEQEKGKKRLSEMVYKVITQYFGEVEQNNNDQLVLPRRPTQREIANLIQEYNQSGLVTKSSSSLSLGYELFSSESEIERILRDSGIPIRRISALREEGGTPEAALWKGLEIQLYQGSGARFDKGLEAIRQKGFERYLRPQEAWELFIDIHEKRADHKLQELFDCSGYEWLNLAWEIQGNSLIAYLDPEGLQWQEYTDPVTKIIKLKYRTSHFTYKDKKSFYLGKIAERGLLDRRQLSELPNDFVQFHCGRSFADLPETMRKEVKIDLPPENLLVPVAHDPSILLFGRLI